MYCPAQVHGAVLNGRSSTGIYKVNVQYLRYSVRVLTNGSIHFEVLLFMCYVRTGSVYYVLSSDRKNPSKPTNHPSSSPNPPSHHLLQTHHPIIFSKPTNHPSHHLLPSKPTQRGSLGTADSQHVTNLISWWAGTRFNQLPS
jgi:hypothetical protein